MKQLFPFLITRDFFYFLYDFVSDIDIQHDGNCLSFFFILKFVNMKYPEFLAGLSSKEFFRLF